MPSQLRQDLDQLTDEWRAHRGAEVALMKGLNALQAVVADQQRQLTNLGDFVEQLERRVKAVGMVSA